MSDAPAAHTRQWRAHTHSICFCKQAMPTTHRPGPPTQATNPLSSAHTGTRKQPLLLAAPWHTLARFLLLRAALPGCLALGVVYGRKPSLTLFCLLVIAESSERVILVLDDGLCHRLLLSSARSSARINIVKT